METRSDFHLLRRVEDLMRVAFTTFAVLKQPYGNPEVQEFDDRTPIVFKEAEESYRYEDEDQSVTGVRVGMRVRHAQFGVGTVLAVEEHTDDYKITVRFNSVGQKKLLAKFAKLEPA